MIGLGSLTARIVVANLLLIAIMLAVVTAVEYNVARRQIDLLYDGRLASAGRVLRSLMDEELDARAASPNPAPAPLLSAEDRKAFSAELGKHLFFKVWLAGKPVETNGGPDLSPPQTDGFTKLEQGGERWRIYSVLYPDVGVALSVAEPQREREEIIWRAVRDLVLPGLLLVPGMLLAVLAVAFYGMRKVRRLAKQLARRSANDLRLLKLHGWPAELQPLVRGANNLLAHLDWAFQTERRVVDLAAHQLRTPLASMRVQLQSAQRAQSLAESREVLARLETTIIQASNLTDRLLALARLESDTPSARRGDMRPELEQAVLEVLAVAEAKEQSITVDAVEEAWVALDPAECRLLCSCLLENAVKYSPPGTAITLTLARRNGNVELSVEDEGPGIPEAERSAVLERFSRGLSGAGKAGSGLGLSIAVAATKRASGTLTLDTAAKSRGLRVHITLPEIHATAAV